MKAGKKKFSFICAPPRRLAWSTFWGKLFADRETFNCQKIDVILGNCEKIVSKIAGVTNNDFLINTLMIAGRRLDVDMGKDVDHYPQV